MKKRFLTKAYWLRVLKLFMFLLPLYFLLQFIGEDKKEFWSFSHLASSIGSAFLMAAVFAYSSRPATENSNTDADIVVIKPTWKQFWIGYLFFAAIGLLLMAILLLIGWVLIYLLSDSQDPFWPVFIKAIATTLIMCLFINSAYFLGSYQEYKRWKKNNRLSNS